MYFVYSHASRSHIRLTSLFRYRHMYKSCTTLRCTRSTVRATCIVYSYIVTAIGTTTMTGYRFLEDQDQYVSTVRTPETATPETVSEERERRRQRRLEQARARRTSEMAEHREERLRNRRVRDRARSTDQTATETAEERHQTTSNQRLTSS